MESSRFFGRVAAPGTIFNLEDGTMTNLDSTKAAIAAAKTRMEKAADDFRKALTSGPTGRANAAILDNLRGDYHGTPMPVNQRGNTTIPHASMPLPPPSHPTFS